MGIPVNRQKLIAFTLGAAIAGMTGTLFAALNTAVFSADFDTPTLIIVYAILILGGAGSIGGVIIGALVVNVSLEILRTPGHATYIFYLAIAIGLIAFVRPWRWFFAVVGGTIAFGYIVHAIVPAIWPQSDTGAPAIGGPLGSFLNSWQLYPTNPMNIGNYCFVILVFVVMGLTLLHGWQRWVALMPTIYLASFVWENRLVMEPSVTRLILIGVILIVLMNLRPQGILGSARVEIV
jgi:ABC-type branched-subunit amino acid transport system permease subunit